MLKLTLQLALFLSWMAMGILSSTFRFVNYYFKALKCEQLILVEVLQLVQMAGRLLNYGMP